MTRQLNIQVFPSYQQQILPQDTKLTMLIPGYCPKFLFLFSVPVAYSLKKSEGQCQQYPG